MHTKAWLRSQADLLDPPTDVECRMVVDRLAVWLRSRPPTGVLTYLSMGGELPAEAVTAMVDRHRYLTTRTPESGWLTIHSIDAPREIHRFGYQQPEESSPTVSAETVGIVLVPGRLFDRAGGRIGWGRGYYDELLARMPRAVAVGVALDRRLVDSIPVEEHDIPMAVLVTESRIIEVPSRPW